MKNPRLSTAGFRKTQIPYAPLSPMASTGQPSLASLQRASSSGRFRLFVNERVTAVFVAFEIVRRGFATEVAVNALIVHVEFAGNVFGVSVRDVCHRYLFRLKNYGDGEC
jgi:hypothetical protein